MSGAVEMPAGAEFRVRHDAFVGLVEAAGELDMASEADFETALRTAAAVTPQLLVDLSRVTFMDCSALGVLARIQRSLESRGGRMCVVAGSPVVSRVFELGKFAISRATSVPEAERLLHLA